MSVRGPGHQNNDRTISQDLSTWCGGVTSFYKGLFYTIANINLPLFVQKEGEDYFVPFLESSTTVSVINKLL